MNINKKNCIILALATLPMLNSCSDSWLEPKPLSFYSPENTYVDAEGLYAALTACERNMRHEFFGDGAPILTEMYLTDIAIHGKTDESGSLVDLDNEMLPSRTKNDMKGKNKWYWEEGFKGIKYANIAISRLDATKYKDEAERKAVLGAAYFQRAYRYYKLTHQFGDVPYLDREITEPKLDFYTYDRWSILEQCKKDMEFAYQWVPEVQPRGRANKDACGVLLMKLCMATGDFDRAITVGKEIVGRHPLMTERFTGNQTDAGKIPAENEKTMTDFFDKAVNTWSNNIVSCLPSSTTAAFLYSLYCSSSVGSACLFINKNSVLKSPVSFLI